MLAQEANAAVLATLGPELDPLLREHNLSWEQVINKVWGAMRDEREREANDISGCCREEGGGSTVEGELGEVEMWGEGDVGR